MGKGLSEIILVDGGNAVLGPMSAESQKYSKESLEKLGVKVLLNNRVKDFDGETVELIDGNSIITKTLYGPPAYRLLPSMGFLRRALARVSACW
ncbi:hypothetical protein LWM68_43075 [Niabella sp. W65]|nr:hypothetical protein [Niabella sp. W65]MCH7368925.1 hypothetical protein [Niabella sp. W65]